MKRKGRIVFFFMLLCVCLLSIGGCGKDNKGKDVDKAGTDLSNGGKETYAAGDLAMGRYMEEELALPEDCYGAKMLTVLENEELLLVDQELQRFVSKDQGNSWEMLDNGWKEQAGDMDYVSSCALSKDGSLVFITVKFTESEETIYRMGILDHQGNYRQLSTEEYALDDLEDQLYQLYGFAPDGKIVGLSAMNTVYAVDGTTGKAEQLFQIQGNPGAGKIIGNFLVLITDQQIYLYDLVEKDLQETPEILNALVKEKLKDQIGIQSDCQPLLFCAGEQPEEWYLAYRDGVYRYHPDIPELEQVINGGLTKFGDPQAMLLEMERLKDGSFVTLFYDGTLSRYVYDATVSALPPHQLTVYSLYDNYSIRQTISLYQKEHPDVYVKLETGLSGKESGQTAEDAIKSLNTRILTGEGPDLLVLDDLPVKSYQEKGVLKDLSEEITAMTGEESLFENLVEAYRQQDGSLYALPARVRLPLQVGKKGTLEQVKDLGSLADAVEAIRQKQPTGKIINTMTEREALELLGLVSQSAWAREDGSLDMEALTEFFEQAKRIWEAEAAGISQSERDAYEEDSMQYSSDISGEGAYYLQTANNLWPLCLDQEEVLALGVIKDAMWTYPLITSMIRENPDYMFSGYAGQVADGFVPKAQTAICANSKNPELASDFFVFLFSKKAQETETVDGYPINEAAFLNMIQGYEQKREDGIMGTMGAGDVNDDFVMIQVYAPDTEEQKQLEELMRAAKNPCTADATIKALVLEIGPSILDGSKTVEEGVAEIAKRVAIYLAE